VPIAGNSLATRATRTSRRPRIVARTATHAVLGLLLQSIIACDATAPVNPTDSAGVFVGDPSLVVSSSGVTAKPVSWNEIDVSWPADSHVTGYQLFRSTTGAAGSYTMVLMTSDTTSTYQDKGLTPSTQYCYEIRSYKTAGKNTNYAAFSGPVCATTLASPVAAPSEEHAMPDSSWIRITWKDNSTNEDGFHIEQAPTTAGPWTQIANAPANATSATGSLSWEQAACFRITAFNLIAVSVAVSACTARPLYPTNLPVKHLDQQSTTVNWIDNSALEDGYEVWRLGATGAWTAIAKVPANTTSYRDAAVTPDALYRYRVRATRDGGYTENSNEVSGVVATTIPAAPTGVGAAVFQDYEGGGWTSILSWTETSTNAEGFRLEGSLGGTTAWSLSGILDATVSSIEDHSFFGFLSSCYRVFAFNMIGTSPPSNVACEGDASAPTNVIATPVDQQSIDVSWSDNTPLETGYEVDRASSADGVWVVAADLSPNVTSFHDTGLTTGQEYCYRIIADGITMQYDFVPAISCATPGSSTSGLQSLRTAVGGRANRRGPVRGKRVPLRVHPVPTSKRTP